MAASAGTAPLLECSICLDRFTDPRMLPCQHTFCLQCLDDLVGDDEATVITCPQCRARHTLPPGRVQGLPGNVLLNNLLSLPVESPTASAQNPECDDCKEKGPVSLCNHCQERVCVECRVQHVELSKDVQQTLDQLRESLSPSGGSTEWVKASLRAVKIERERMNAAVQEQADWLLQALATRQTQLDAIFQTLVGVHEDLLQPAGRKPFLENFSRQAERSKNTQSLQQLKGSLKKVKTFARLLHTQEAEVKFRSQSLEMNFENWGSVHIGDTVVEVASGMKNLTLTAAAGEENTSVSGAVGQPSLGASTSSVDQPQSTGVAGAPRTVLQSQLTHGQSLHPFSVPKVNVSRQRNTLPRNVDYRRKGKNVLVIGPELGLRDGERSLNSPTNCIYNAHTNDLLVCDNDNDRVLAMKTDGTNCRVFYRTHKPWDITVSDDGQNVFILTVSPFEIHHISIHGCHVKSSTTCSVIEFQEIHSLVYHSQQLAIVLQELQSVVLFNMSLEQTRSFRVNAVQDPRAMTVDSDGNFYITDSKTGTVHVYTWGGQHTRSFGAVSGRRVTSLGICVDGDGVVCVSRYFLGRIDVYDREGRQVNTLGMEGRFPVMLVYPRELHLLPDGRIAVVDSENNRLKIL